MPHLDDRTEALLRSTEHLSEAATTQLKSFFDGFSDFALRDNVLEVAVGLIIASSFTTIVNSLVSDVLLPPISLLPGLGRNLDEKFAVLRSGPHHARGGHYNTLQQARDDGAVVMAYGFFFNKCINFLGIVLSLFLIARIYQYLSSDTMIKKQVKCKFCRKWISMKARRCVNCTSWQDGREEHQD